MERTAAAPISWGVCEVPGWGLQLPADRVLSEMAQLGFAATELGATGYLPGDPTELRALLATHGMALIAGFNSLPLADPALSEAALELAEANARVLSAAGATVFVTCAISGIETWERPQLDDRAWAHLCRMVAEVDDLCRRHGLEQAFHPHVDSLVETAEEVQRLLDGTDVGWVLDTGHMVIGGADPLLFARDHPHRIRLVHLKDMSTAVAARLNADALTLMEAVQEGLFVPLGEGDVAIADIVRTLERAGYDGWYVIEQDAAITDGEPPIGAGPFRDVQRSVAYLRSLDAELSAA